jgi:hypothetical protein
VVFDVFGRVFIGHKRKAVRFPFGRVEGAQGTKVAVYLSVYDGGQLVGFAFDEAERRVSDSSRFGVNILFEVFCQVLHDKDVFTLDVGRRWSRLKAN